MTGSQKLTLVFILNDMLEQSNFRILRCLFRDGGVVLEQKVTPKTPIKIKSYLLGAIFRPFLQVLGAIKPKSVFVETPDIFSYFE